MPKKYRLIPRFVEAIQITPENVRRIAIWSGGFIHKEVDPEDRVEKVVGINVPTEDGVKQAKIIQNDGRDFGDFVIKHTSGKFEVLDYFRFDVRYELISEEG